VFESGQDAPPGRIGDSMKDAIQGVGWIGHQSQ
jgi:hypothetical protein